MKTRDLYWSNTFYALLWQIRQYWILLTICINCSNLNDLTNINISTFNFIQHTSLPTDPLQSVKIFLNMCCISRYRGNWLVGSYEAAFREDMRIGNTQVGILCQNASRAAKTENSHVWSLQSFPNGTVDNCFLLSYSHPDYYWSTTPSTHFFRSHRSSTLDFHLLSHYSYIKAIML